MSLLKQVKFIKEDILDHHGFRRYAANTSWMFAAQILRMLSGLIVGVWVARYLGPEKYGVLNYALAFSAIFGGIAKLGLDNILVRDLVNNPENRDVFLGTAFWMKLGAAIIVIIAISFATSLTNNDFTTKLYVCIIAAGLVFHSVDVVDFYFQSKVLSKYVSFCKTAQLVLSAIIKVWLILVRADLICFVWVTLVDQFVMAVFLGIAYKYQRNGGFYRYFDSTVAKKLIKDCWPLILTGIAVAIYMRIGQLMIKEMLGPSALGLYSAAVRLSEGWYFIPVIITSSLFPAIVNARKIDEKLYYDRLQRLIGLMTWGSVAVALPTAIFSKWLVTILYGDAYADAAAILRVYVWAGVFLNMGMASGRWLLSENYQRIMFFRTALGAAANIILNLVLIPRYGILGAAYAALIAYFIVGFLYDLLDPRTRRMFKMKVYAFAPNTLWS